MGFFKDFKDDFSQAVNELMPADDNLETSTNEDDVEVNTLEGEVDVETELSKLDGLLEQVTKQEAEKVAAARSAAEMAARNASAPTERAAVPVPASVPEPERNETVSNITKATQEERKMADNTTAPVTNNQSAPVSDEVSVITEGTIDPYCYMSAHTGPHVLPYQKVPAQSQSAANALTVHGLLRSHKVLRH